MNTISHIVGFSGDIAKAAAPIPPFVILRRADHPMNQIWIRHEHIHHLQILESRYLRQIIGRGEYRYARKMLGKDHMQAYLRKATEQEAYLNQTSPDYLHIRPLGATWRYLRQKTPFHLENHQVIIDPQ